jgi:hypothetical protein
MKKIIWFLVLWLFWTVWNVFWFSIDSNNTDPVLYSWGNTILSWSVSFTKSVWDIINSAYYYIEDNNWNKVLTWDLCWFSPCDYTWDLSWLSDSIYNSNVYFKVNWSEYTWTNVSITYDKTAPVVSNDGINGGKQINGKTYLSGSTVWVSLDMDINENLTTWSVEYLVNGISKEIKTLSVWTNTYSFAVTTWDLTEWENTITVKIKDGVDNINIKTYKVYYDTTAPVVSNDKLSWEYKDWTISWLVLDKYFNSYMSWYIYTWSETETWSWLFKIVVNLSWMDQNNKSVNEDLIFNGNNFIWKKT